MKQSVRRYVDIPKYSERLLMKTHGGGRPWYKRLRKPELHFKGGRANVCFRNGHRTEYAAKRRKFNRVYRLSRKSYERNRN